MNGYPASVHTAERKKKGKKKGGGGGGGKEEIRGGTGQFQLRDWICFHDEGGHLVTFAESMV